MTGGVDGIVAGIVKLDDAGAWLVRRPGTGRAGRAQRAAGLAILAAAPKLMKGLAIAGTAAMFLVGGGILAHGIPAIGHAIDALAAHALAVPGIGAALRLAAALAGDALVGIAAGALAVAAMSLARRVRRPRAGAS